MPKQTTLNMQCEVGKQMTGCKRAFPVKKIIHPSFAEPIILAIFIAWDAALFKIRRWHSLHVWMRMWWRYRIESLYRMRFPNRVLPDRKTLQRLLTQFSEFLSLQKARYRSTTDHEKYKSSRGISRGSGQPAWTKHAINNLECTTRRHGVCCVTKS